MSSVHRQDDQWLHDVLRDLSRARDGAGEPAPDLSRSIMGRLGYMRVSPAVARRRARMRWANRAGLVCVLGVAAVIGWRVFESSPQVRRPADTTVPQAISHDVQNQQERLGTMIQTIREISSPRFAPRLTSDFSPQNQNPHGRGAAAVQPAPGTALTPFSADVQERDSHRPPPRQESDDNPMLQQEMRDDVNRDTALPVRWV